MFGIIELELFDNCFHLSTDSHGFGKCNSCIQQAFFALGSGDIVIKIGEFYAIIQVFDTMISKLDFK